MPPPVLLEVCVESPRAAAIAQAGGAGRIELCADLSVDGLTPSEESMRATRELCRIPVTAMVRPRAGDFRYTEEELRDMERSIDLIREAGLDGVVFGALTADGRVDEAATGRLVRCAGELPVTFHRAFDETPDPLEALDTLAALGVTRVLTAGQAPTALAGAELLTDLVRHARGRLVVMPGGSVRAENVAELLRRTGAREVHSSVGGEEAITVEAVRQLAPSSIH